MFNRYFRFFLFAILSLCTMTGRYARAQTISGVINSYARALAFDYCQNTVTIAGTTDFAVGDSVLIMQMTGVTIDQTNTASFGTVTKENGISNVEFAQVAAITPTTLRFKNTLLNQYNDTSGVVQVIKVPVYQDVTIKDTLRAKPWDGSTGGVLVLVASGSVTMNAPIDVSGEGFRGGGWDGSMTNTTAKFQDKWFYSIAQDSAGLKGEGIAGNISQSIGAGRGAPATGGGGGNALASGGGGGGSFGAAGGNGGYQTNSPTYGSFPNGGVGGYAFMGKAGQMTLMMGGGGGSGQESNGFGSAGGNGGGIAILITPSLTPNGKWIISRGMSASASGIDGAGGGGAGGAVYVDVPTINGVCVAILNGGDGGKASSIKYPPYAFGPGGGGATGALWTKSNVLLNSASGIYGLVTDCTDATLNLTAYGATAGQSNGSAFPPIPIPESTIPFTAPSAALHLETICSGEKTTFSASGGDSYAWTGAGITDPTNAQQTDITPAATTVYHVTITKGACQYIDTVHIEVLPQPKVVFSGITAACSGSKTTYTIPQEPNTTYTWQVTGGTPSATSGASIDVDWTTAGTQSITLQASNGKCSNSSVQQITVGSPVTPQIVAGKTTICSGESTTLSADATYASYLWHPGNQTTPSITVNTTGTFTLDVTSASQCSGTSSPMTVTVNPAPVTSINATLTLLDKPTDQSTLSVTGGPFASYLWSTGETTDNITVTKPGTYSVKVTDANNCDTTVTIDIIDAASLPAVELALKTISAYAGDHIILPISILSSRNLDKGAATDYSYSIRFNKSLLAPAVAEASPSINGRWRSITKQGTRAATLTSGDLDHIELIAALGDTTATPIYFDNITWSNGKAIRTTLDSGWFELLGVCHAGGTRLFSEDGHVLLAAPRPNPIHDFGTLDYSLAEIGTTQLLIRDMLGRTVTTIMNGDAIPGDYHAILDAAALPNGMYNIILRTPTQVFTSKMEVYH